MGGNIEKFCSYFGRKFEDSAKVYMNCGAKLQVKNSNINDYFQVSIYIRLAKKVTLAKPPGSRAGGAPKAPGWEWYKKI